MDNRTEEDIRMAESEIGISAIDILSTSRYIHQCNLEHVKNTQTKAYIFEKVLILAFKWCSKIYNATYITWLHPLCTKNGYLNGTYRNIPNKGAGAIARSCLIVLGKC